MTTLDLGEINVKLRADRNRLKLDLAAGEQDVKAAGDRMGRSNADTALQWASKVATTWKDAGIRAGEGFWRGADGRLRDAKGRFAAAGAELAQAAAGGASAGMRNLSTGAGNATTALSALGSGVSGVIPWLLGLAAAAIFLVPVLYALGGALGAIPALTTGGLAAVATLAIGFMGLSDAFKKTTSAGGAVVDKAHQIMLAERRVRDANMEVLASQEALNRARKTAAERMADLTRSLAGAHLDEESAVAAVASAERDLAAARLTENPNRIAAADLALRQQKQALADIQDRVEDLTDEQAEAARKGVEGSDEVTAALDRQRKATEGVTDAQYDLKEAQKPAPSGGGGAAAQVTKLAPSALAAVAAIKALKPAFEDLRLDVQEKLFKGVGEEITLLADAWLPTLHTRLGSMAGMFNGLFKSWAETSKKPEFIANIAAGWEHIEKLIDRVGKAIVGPGLEAFGKLSKAAGPFIDALGNGIAGIVEDFAKWIDKSEKSGALTTFFEKAGAFLTAIFDIGKDAASIVGSIFSILFKAEDKNPGSSFETFHEAMDKLAKWFDDPANQQKIADFFTAIEDFAWWVKDEAIPTIAGWIKKIGEWADKFKGWADKAGDFKDGVVGVFTTVGGAVDGFLGTFDRVVSSTINLALWLIEQAFKPIAAAATWLWDTILKPVWDKIAAGATWLWEHGLKPIWDKITGGTSVLGDAFKDVFGKIGGYVSDAFTNALEFAKKGMNGLIRLLNTSIGAINTKVIDNANKVPGVNYPHIPDIPELAAGGLVRATRGGTVARVAEAGQDEIVSPVDMMRRIVAEELARVQGEQGSHGPDVIENHIHIGDEVTRVVRTEIGSSNRTLKRRVTSGSGAR